MKQPPCASLSQPLEVPTTRLEFMVWLTVGRQKILNDQRQAAGGERLSADNLATRYLRNDLPQRLALLARVKDQEQRVENAHAENLANGGGDR